MGRTRTVGRAFQAIALAVVVFMLGSGIALADEIHNEIDTSPDATLEEINLAVGDPARSVTYKVQPENGDLDNGCNFEGASESLVVNVVSSNTSAATVTPTQLTFDNCSGGKAISVTAVGGGTSTISLSEVSNNSGGTFGYANATFKVNVSASDSNAPQNASISIDDGAAWTNDAEGDVSVDISASDNVGVASYRLAETQAGLASASAVAVSPAEASFSRNDLSFQLSGSESASKAVWLRVCDAANNCVNASDDIGWDKTAPQVAYLSASPAPNGAGWNNTDVVATFRATDNLSGFAPSGDLTKDATATTSGEGESVTVGSPAFTDRAGNTAAAGAATSAAFKIDKTRPSVSVTGVDNGATYTLGSVPLAACNTSDPLSGVATHASLSLTGGTSNGVGEFTATCSGAIDVAGNSQAASVSVKYNVYYGGLSGILQPINPDNSSMFSRGKAVPVKFQLAGDPPAFDMSGWKLERIKLTCTNFETEEATLEPVAENPSNAFRYDSTADQYINNASFKDQAAGTCWKVRVTLDSGQKLDSAIFKLQK
jgi:hypothetical protein